MKKSISGTSIAEALVVMVIVVTWVVWMYDIITRAQKLSNETSSRIIATQIAREWIEAMMNIRDTNYILFSWDIQNCWNVVNYNTNCFWDTSWTYDFGHQQYYKVYKDTDNRWKTATGSIAWWYTNTAYKNTWKVNLDANWLYTQNWGTPFTPLFTRHIYINYIDTNGGSTDSNDEKMEITSTVEWADRNSTQIHNVTLTTLLSNWRGN